MMSKILVKLYVPIIEEQYDILIPKNRRIYNVIKLLNKAIYELSGGCYEVNRKHILYDKLTGIPYDLNLSINETNITNGKEIVLI